MPHKIQATLLSAYPFHMVNQAQQLDRLNILERFVTAVPVNRTGISSSKVKNRLYYSGMRYYIRKVLPRSDTFLSRTVIKDFDKWAISHIGSPNVINALSGFATNTLIQASNRGIAVCCDRGSWHILEQKQVLDDEAEKIGCQRTYFDPFIVDRELIEYELADRIFVPSEPAVKSFLKHGVDSAKIVKIPYGVDISSFRPPANTDNRNGIICVGTVGMQKGHHILVDAFRSLKTCNTSLTLVGPIDSEWIKRLNIKHENIHTTGTLPRIEVIKHLQKASIFVLASLQEGLALVIAQAMACGLPIVASEATGARELMDDGVEGFIVPTGDAQSLAIAMNKLLSDRELTFKMGLAARNRVESLGGWDQYGQNIMNTFAKLIQEKYEKV